MGVHHLGWAARREREGVLREGASDRDVCSNATAVLLPLIGMGIVPLVVWPAVTPPFPVIGIVLMLAAHLCAYCPGLVGKHKSGHFVRFNQGGARCDKCLDVFCFDCLEKCDDDK